MSFRLLPGTTILVEIMLYHLSDGPTVMEPAGFEPATL